MGAVLVSLATGLAGAAALIPPLRFLIRKVVPKPGQGIDCYSLFYLSKVRACMPQPYFTLQLDAVLHSLSWEQ